MEGSENVLAYAEKAFFAGRDQLVLDIALHFRRFALNILNAFCSDFVQNGLVNLLMSIKYIFRSINPGSQSGDGLLVERRDLLQLSIQLGISAEFQVEIAIYTAVGFTHHVEIAHQRDEATITRVVDNLLVAEDLEVKREELNLYDRREY